jgi:predicted phosphohydrolase
VIRVAAVGDVHVGIDSAGRLAPRLHGLAGHADLFLLAGDLTHRGRPEEAKVLAEELRGVGVPTIAVLGNHDYHSDEQEAVTEVLEEAGIRVLEGDAVVVEVRGRRVGIAGSKGFGGGFAGASASDFGEPEMKAFVGHTRTLACSTTRRWPRPWPGSRARSTPSSAATCWPRRSTGPGPTWPSTATPTGAAATAPPPAGCRSATSPPR